MKDELDRLRELAVAVGVWRFDKKCQKHCEECDPSFHCFADPYEKRSNGLVVLVCHKPRAERCDGENHTENCPKELGLQDVLEAHNRLLGP